MSFQIFLKLVAVTLPLLFLCSCDSDEGVQEYTQTKETTSNPPPETTSNPPQAVSFAWVAPSTWKDQGKTSSMRLATYEIAGNGGNAECRVSVLDRDGGGVLLNINKWRAEMGLSPIDEPTMEKEVPKLTIAGFPARFLDASGSYQEHNTTVKRETSRLLGVILPTPHHTFFIKMVGPEDMVGQQYENFKTFYQSFTLRQEK